MDDEISVGDLVELRGISVGFSLHPGLVLQVKEIYDEDEVWWDALILFPDLQKPEWICTNYLRIANEN